MASHIASLTTSMCTALDNLSQHFTEDQSIKVEVALVGYYDLPVDHLLPKWKDFTSNIDDVKKELVEWKSKVGGGNDLPENVIDGLEIVNDPDKISWKQGTLKSVILIADAPMHGK